MLGFADRVAADLGEEDEPADDMLDEGVALVDEAEARALVRDWIDVYPDRWASIVHTGGDERAAVEAVVRGAVEVAVYEHATTPQELLVKLEAEPLPAGAALALVLPPFFVWSLLEAHAAVAAASGRGGAVELLQPVEEVAYALIRVDHEQRVRRLAGRVEAELPFAAYPSASDQLAEGSRQARSDVAFVRAVAALMLAAYVQHLAPASFAASPN